jgi:hypothetical protein
VGRAFRRLANLLLGAGILATSWLALSGAVRVANVRADIRIVGHESKTLYRAFEAFYHRNLAYPGDYSGTRFEIETLDPLRRRGYYRGHITFKLLGGRVDAYGSPDDRGPNQEFWLEVTLRSAPSIRFVIAKSDDAPLGAGQWLEGVYVYRGGELERL